MFLTRNKKNYAYPCKPQFYYIKVGFKGSKLYRRVFVMFCVFLFFFFFQKIDFDISCKLICMECQNLFSVENSPETICTECHVQFSPKNKKKVFQNIVC